VRERVTALEEEIASLHELASRTDAQHTYDLDTAQSRIDAAHSETEAIRTETDALRHRGAELEATFAELDAALAKRSAEIELLRGALGAADGAAGGAGLTGDELETRLAEARSEASSVLVAEVELLRAQVQEHRDNFEQAQTALRAAVSRAEAAEATAAKRGGELEEFGAKVREQITEVQRSRHELVTAAEATQHALEIEKARADTAEAKVRQLSEAVRAEAEQRVRAEETLVQVTAQHAMTQESLSLEADSDRP
jgi:chromosome segregation ATPase